MVAPKLGVFDDPKLFELPKLLVLLPKMLELPNAGAFVVPNPPEGVGFDPKPFPLAVVVFAPKEKIPAEFDTKEFEVVTVFSNGLTFDVVAKREFVVPKPDGWVVVDPPNMFVGLFVDVPKPLDAPNTDEAVVTVLNVFAPNEAVVVPNAGVGVLVCPNVGTFVFVKGEDVATELPKGEEVVLATGAAKVATGLLPPNMEDEVVPKFPLVASDVLFNVPKPPNPVELIGTPKLEAAVVFTPKPTDGDSNLLVVVEAPKLLVDIIALPKVLTELVAVPKPLEETVGTLCDDGVPKLCGLETPNEGVEIPIPPAEEDIPKLTADPFDVVLGTPPKFMAVALEETVEDGDFEAPKLNEAEGVIPALLEVLFAILKENAGEAFEELVPDEDKFVFEPPNVNVLFVIIAVVVLVDIAVLVTSFGLEFG